MPNLEFWHRGQKYDFAKPADKPRIMDAIDDNQKRSAANDQTMLAYSLLGVIHELLAQTEKE